MFRNIIMDGNENIPTDFFKGIKISLKNVLKHHDINLPKITNAVIQCNKIVINVLGAFFSTSNSSSFVIDLNTTAKEFKAAG